MACLSKALSLPETLEKGECYDCQWLPPHWDWVDPVKDIKAEIYAIQSGLKSRSQSISERGYDAVEVDAEIAADQQREKELGIVLKSENIRSPNSSQSTYQNQ